MTQYEYDKPDNLVEMFEESVAKFAHNRWFGTKNKDKEYEWITYAEVSARVDNLRGGLASLGVGKGDTVAIIANNCVEWAICCYATYGLGAKFVPMYEAELIQTWKYITNDSDAKVLFVSRPDIFDKVKDFVKEIKGLEHVILIEGAGENSMAELEKIGKVSPVKSVYPGPDDIAGLIYTSGTTGEPKGVLLSHGNLTSNVHQILKIFKEIDDKDRSLSFLPWAHSYGQTVEVHTFMRLGASSGFAEATTTIVDDLALVKPTILVAVPRIFNRVYDGLWARFNDEGGLKKALFVMGVNAAAEKRELAKKGKSSFLTNLKFNIADTLVFSKIRERFGGKLRFCYSSSAAISTHIIDFFFDIGIPIYEAWGMTELSPAGTINTPEKYKTGSVGLPLDKMKVVVDKSMVEADSKDGELVVYGPNVMKGYYKKPEQTKEMLMDDGGLRSGDRGYIDEDGFVYITGRIKEQFKLENGKFVFPAAIEEEIKLIPYIEQAMIYGLNKPYTVCLVVPDFEVLDKWAKERGLPDNHDALVKTDEVKKLFEEEITKHLKGKFGGYEIPKKFYILSEGFTVENKMLTQTLKLKRRNVLDKYADDIEALYKS